MSTLTIRHADGTFACCGGYGEHFDHCDQRYAHLRVVQGQRRIDKERTATHLEAALAAIAITACERAFQVLDAMHQGCAAEDEVHAAQRAIASYRRAMGGSEF